MQLPALAFLPCHISVDLGVFFVKLSPGAFLFLAVKTDVKMTKCGAGLT